MHRYEELEKIYYKKKYLKYFYLFLLFIGLFILLFIVFMQYNNHPKSVHKIEKKELKKQNDINHTKKAIQQKEIIPKTKEEKKIVPRIEKKEDNKTRIIEKKLVLYPIFPEIDKPVQEVKTKKVQTTLNNNIVQPKAIVKIETKPIQTNNSTLKIVIKQAKTTNDLIYMFEKSPTYDIAMKITKQYFNKKEYKQAIEWAKKANKINPEDYESWYIFAKSLIQLGDKEKAKKVLIAYLNTYGPDKHIEELLRSIK